MAVSLEALKRFTCEEGGSEIEVILPFDACPDSAPPLLQHPEILAGPMLPPTAREHLMGLAPWAFTHASKNHAAPPPEQPTDGIWPSPTTDHLSTSLPHGFGGQWCRLTLHVDQLVLPSPGAAAEFRPKSYKYYASYKLPGAYNVDIDTAAQTAKAQQVSSSTSPSSSPTTSWVVPLSHCGIHWVRADSALAAALARSPLLLRVFRVYGKTTGLLAAKPHQASGDDHTETWLSCTQVGECTVDLSSMISSSAIRKHQPNTRWLSGTFSLIEPESKVFANNRIQVRSLLELLPSTLPPLSWLSKSAWQPIMAPNPAPLLAENVYPDASLSENKASNPEPSLENTARDEIEGNVEANVMAEERVHVDAIEPLTAEASAEIVAPPSPSVELQPPSPIDQASVKIQPPSPIDQATFLNDYLFSFSRGVNEEVPEEVADAMLSPLDPEPEQVACEDFEAGGVEIVQALSSDADVALAVQSSADHRSMSSDVPDMASDKATLRRQLQELELMSMGFRTRFGSLDGQESPTSSPQIQDQQAVVIVTEEEVVSLPAPLLAPRVERTCSEDGANLLNPMFGYASGSDSDDTDELIARASGARASGAKTGIKMDPTVNAPTLFSSALDPDLIFSFTRPNRPVTASSSQSALSTYPAPQFMAWGIGQLTANSSPATEEKPQDDFYFSSDPAPSRVSYEAPSKPARFTFSNALPGLLPDFKLDFSG